MKQVYINTITGEYPLTTKNIRQENKNISFSNIFVAPEWYSVVTNIDKPIHDILTQKIVELHPVLIDGVWTQVWEIQDLYNSYTDDNGVFHSKEEQESENRQRIFDAQSTEIRNKRNMLLSETDYLALVDCTLTPEMGAYRKALRDITSQEGFPENVIWPVKPV
jgi:hypothetical protein